MEVNIGTAWRIRHGNRFNGIATIKKEQGISET